ncbi:GGDEF domain-containing protein [Thalassotalea euphylliae]|uniref:GGDEF domain-containing protein n=1 Tax=Thalassotalea euphylliae TaxID=1655234 RepID=UPI00362D528C
MDIFTLIMCTLLVSFFMMLTMFSLFKGSRHEAYLLDWGVAGACFCASSFFGVLGTQFGLSGVIASGIANSFYITAHAAIFTGLFVLNGGQSQRAMLLVVWLFILFLHQFEYIYSSVNNRQLVFYPLIIAFDLLAASQAHKLRKQSYGYGLIKCVMLFFVAQMVIRTLYMLIDGKSMAVFGSEFVQTSGTLFLLLFLFLQTLAFVLVFNTRKENQIRSYAITDHLTGWLNRRALEPNTKSLLAKAKREKVQLGVIMFDIDNFKAVNDEYGHLCGDEVIKQVANKAKQVNRDSDFHYRVGGEEFLVLLYNVNLYQVQQLAERVRAAIDELMVVHNHKKIHPKVSVGTALSSKSDEQWEALISRADKALYFAKENGKNQVKAFQPDMDALATN